MAEQEKQEERKIVLVIPQDEAVGQKMVDIINKHYPNEEDVTFSFVKEKNMFDFVVEKLQEFELKSNIAYQEKLLEDFKNNPVNKSNSFAIAVKISFLIGKINAGWFSFERLRKRTNFVKTKEDFLAMMSQCVIFGFIAEDDSIPGNFKVTIHPEQKIKYFEYLIQEKQKDIEQIQQSILSEMSFIEEQKSNGNFTPSPDFLTQKEFFKSQEDGTINKEIEKISSMMFGKSGEKQQ